MRLVSNTPAGWEVLGADCQPTPSLCFHVPWVGARGRSQECHFNALCNATRHKLPSCRDKFCHWGRRWQAA